MTSFIRTATTPSASRESGIVRPPQPMGAFEFISLSTLRAAQLIRGCIPTVDALHHKPIVVAQMEVAAGRIGHRDQSSLAEAPVDAGAS